MAGTSGFPWSAAKTLQTYRTPVTSAASPPYYRRFMFVLLLLLIAAPLAAQDAGLTPFQEHKAQALLREKLPCLGCHELAGEGGRIAPSLSTVGQRRDPAYIRAIISDPQALVPGAPMPRTPMPPSTRDLIVRYLSRGARPLSQAESTVYRAGGAPSTHQARAGRGPENVTATYALWCSTCHGARGDGNGPNAKFLPVAPAVHSSAQRMSVRSDDALFDAIAGGGAIMGMSPRMPAFGETLSTSQIRALVSYIRTLCQCQGPAWSRDAR